MKTTAQNQMDSQVEELVAQFEARDIECRKQSTYFGDEVCVHIHGNNRPAVIYPYNYFVEWAKWYLSLPEGYFDGDEEDEEEIYDLSPGAPSYYPPQVAGTAHADAQTQAPLLSPPMKLPRLIGLNSPAPGCGKTSVADLLIEYRRVSFAAPLKRAVSHMLHGLGLPGFYAYTCKEAIIPELGVSARHMMQTLCTEWGRACIHPDFWVMIARAKTHRIMNDGESVVVDDVRFPNEAAMIRELGGELWRIERPGVAYNGSHESEGGLEGITPDRVIINDGTIDQLKEKIYEC